MNFPKIYLAIDNCFASKRWTTPREWMELIKSLGIDCIEASADTEADPLYCGPDYMRDWAEEIVQLEKQIDLKVVNLYSGHGTYTTLGLSHTDIRIQERMVKNWHFPMIDAAKYIHAGLGFYSHAFPHSVLQDPKNYKCVEKKLFERLSEVGEYAVKSEVSPLCIEQMYTPHQIPWTIEGAKNLLRNVFHKNKSVYYITIDTGHQTGQRKYIKPDIKKLQQHHVKASEKVDNDDIWVGPEKLNEMYRNMQFLLDQDIEHELGAFEEEMDKYPYFYSQEKDSDTYRWLQEIGCYSPIIHLQQVIGDKSAHLPFTSMYNERGKIHPDKVLKALHGSYLAPDDDSLPDKTNTIYLTLELFSGTAETSTEIIEKVRESIKYWRRFVPQDGLSLDELVGK